MERSQGRDLAGEKGRLGVTMSAAVNAVAQAIKERRAERERSAKLTTLQRLAAEDAETAERSWVCGPEQIC